MKDRVKYRGGRRGEQLGMTEIQREGCSLLVLDWVKRDRRISVCVVQEGKQKRKKGGRLKRRKKI
jgi:hypothetical protein